MAWTVYLVVLAAALEPARAQSHNVCAPRDKVVADLQKKYFEARMGASLANATPLLEIWTSPTIGSWTVIITRSTGISCILASGNTWMDDAPVLPGDPDLGKIRGKGGHVEGLSLTLSDVLALGAFRLGIFGWHWRVQRELHTRINRLRDELNQHKLVVAQQYVSTESLVRTEERPIVAINGLSSKINRIAEVRDRKRS